MLSNELLMRMKNNLGFAAGMDSYWEDSFAQREAKIGDKINLRVPVRFEASDGAALVEQDVEERDVELRISYHKHTAFAFPQRDLTLSIDNFAEKYLDSASVTLANAYDVAALDFCYKRTYNVVGSPGTIPSAIKTYAQGSAKLNMGGCPIDDKRTLVIDSNMQVEIVDAVKGLFNGQKEISDQYRKGRMGFAYGMNWVEDQNVRTHAVGALGGTPLVNGAGQTGSSLITDGWTAQAATRLKEGDVFTIAGVYAVNPVSGDTLAHLKQHVVAADGASDGSGNMTISLRYPIITSGPYKNCSAVPADNAALTIVGAASTLTPQGIVFHKKAFCKAAIPFQLPGGVQMAARSIDKQSGLSLSIVQQYDIKSHKTFTRVDTMFGFAVPIPEWACRVAS